MYIQCIYVRTGALLCGMLIRHLRTCDASFIAATAGRHGYFDVLADLSGRGPLPVNTSLTLDIIRDTHTLSLSLSLASLTKQYYPCYHSRLDDVTCLLSPSSSHLPSQSLSNRFHNSTYIHTSASHQDRCQPYRYHQYPRSRPFTNLMISPRQTLLPATRSPQVSTLPSLSSAPP